MNKKELVRAKKICDKATPMRWFAGKSDIVDASVNVIAEGNRAIAKGCSKNDAWFIASSRQFLPKAIARIEKL